MEPPKSLRELCKETIENNGHKVLFVEPTTFREMAEEWNDKFEEAEAAEVLVQIQDDQDEEAAVTQLRTLGEIGRTRRYYDIEAAREEFY